MLNILLFELELEVFKFRVSAIFITFKKKKKKDRFLSKYGSTKLVLSFACIQIDSYVLG